MRILTGAGALACLCAAMAFCQPAPRDVLVQSLEGARGDKLAVVVGIGGYSDPGISDLPLAVADAAALAGVLADAHLGAFSREAVRLLTDDAPEADKPSRLGILEALNTAARLASEDDTLLFYFAGHGVEDYLLPQDARLGLLEDTAIPIARVDQIIAASRARRRIVIYDCCHSGGAQAGVRTSEGMAARLAESLFEGAEGRVTLSSCSRDEVSWEWPEKGHGVFTSALLDALQGAADANGDGVVVATEAAEYVQREVKRWAMQARKVQTPRLSADVSGPIVLTMAPVGRRDDLPSTPRQTALAAFIEDDPTWMGNIALCERDLGAPLSAYATYTAYGQPFPKGWVSNVMGGAGRGCILFWEPWGQVADLRDVGTSADGAPAAPSPMVTPVCDSAYLDLWALQAAQNPGPLVVVFGSEANLPQPGGEVEPEAFVKAFRTVSDVLKSRAPWVEVALVLSAPAAATDWERATRYDPGPEYADWVGFSAYDRGNAEVWAQLQTCLDRARVRWPAARLGVFEVGCEASAPGAAERLSQFLQAQVGSLDLVSYFSLDARRRDVNPRPVDYSLRPGSRVLDVWRQAVRRAPVAPLTINAPRPSKRFARRAEAFIMLQRALEGHGTTEDDLLALASARPSDPQADARSMVQFMPADHPARQAVAVLEREGVLYGYPDGRPYPDRYLTAQEMCAMLARLLHVLSVEGLKTRAPATSVLGGDTDVGSATVLAAVPFDHWAYDAVATAEEAGLVGHEAPVTPVDFISYVRRSTLFALSRDLAVMSRP